MLYNFRINIILRVGILLVLVAAFVLSFREAYFLTTGFIGILLIIAVSNLISYVNQTNKDLANFFAGVQYNDFTTTASAAHKGESFGELHASFNLINRKFQDIRAEKEANHQFLFTIVEHIDIGLLCVDANEEIILMNKALQHILRKSYLVNLDGLKKIDETLWKVVKETPAGERELVKFNINNKLLQLSIQVVDLTLNKEQFRLISFQNIQSELEEQELEAWQKLIRILTHEIMNSVAPIASLSSTIKDILASKPTIDEPFLKDMTNSIGVIQKRSEGLLDFTETYRSLTRIPPPKFQVVEAQDLVHEIATLMKPEVDAKNIKLNILVPPTTVSFQGDPNLLEQVLINLIKNAIDALSEVAAPQIDLLVQRAGNHKIMIQVADNGSGIKEEMMEQIFVPFFTTKDTGSGIGLSLSRQIIRLHKGKMEVQSIEGEGTKVSLIL